MPVSKAATTEKNPVEYQEGVRRASASRRAIAEQLGQLIQSSEMTGSHPLVAKRIKAYAKAVKSEDAFAIRGALMELGQAVGVTVAALDLESPGGARAAA